MALGTQPKGAVRGGAGGWGRGVRSSSEGVFLLINQFSFFFFLKKKMGYKAPPIHIGLLRKVKFEVEL